MFREYTSVAVEDREEVFGADGSCGADGRWEIDESLGVWVDGRVREVAEGVGLTEEDDVVLKSCERQKRMEMVSQGEDGSPRGV